MTSTDPPRHRRKSKTRARKVLERPQPAGWQTSDDDEIALRRWRGQTEIVSVEALEPDIPFFGIYRVQSGSGSHYDVEIRDLIGRRNSCGCIDHQVNGLGTCKHIEGVLTALRRGRVRAFKQAAIEGSPRTEVFLNRVGDPAPVIAWAADSASDNVAAGAWLAPFQDDEAALSPEPDRIHALLDAAAAAPSSIRISTHFRPWLARLQRLASRDQARAAFLAGIAAGDESWDIVKHPLLPYQREGVLHLVFGERALLADDMGLGKTVQAIAASEMLAKLRGIRRVLIVCPTSVKAEWEDQIARFTDRPSRFVLGSRADRLAAYAEPVFFMITNYEQVLQDADDINRLLRPDIVILDEAQRIKNWQTKTARKVKSLRSPYAFVLTGTPIENRIDEAYSIVQFLDPEIFGPLFRFNRDFYVLDTRGRPTEYKNLAELRRRLQPVMLRRRKADVEAELPGRTVKTFFVPMVDEQLARYEDYRLPAARLAAQAQRRPLTKEEHDRLQQLLACMRMICDSPAILDPTCRISPKLEELEGILSDLLAEPGRKVIIFSEWERMLGLVRELASEIGVDCAWHTGSVPQIRRRAEITRFKQDSACRLFLSTDSGSVGLNLQVATAVVNVDLPWNPAKLEQRIARAWRKHQSQAVTVINLVTEDSIEHGILHLLTQKQALADGVLDGAGDLAELKMPSGRAAFIERMQAVMTAAERPKVRVLTPEEALVDALKRRHGDRLLLVERRGARLLVVLDTDAATMAAERLRAAEREGHGLPPVEFIDRDAWQAMQRLASAGVVQFTDDSATHRLYQAADLAEADAARSDPMERAAELKRQADRSARMGAVLAAGGFAEEAVPSLAKALTLAAASVMARKDELPADANAATPDQIRILSETGALPPRTIATLTALWSGHGLGRSDVMSQLAEETASILAAI